ncbi:MAG TPA: GNAT family N-acetyltransferase [Actinomycetes bacterium]|nr:GNAT family N-acetyltransferase [Actinomycetes bacterium]
MPGAVTIRTAVAADDGALRRIDATSWDSSSMFPSVLATVDDHPFFGDRHLAEDHLVAEIDGSVVGYVRLRPGTPLPESSHVLQVNGIAVDAAARRRGVAAALLAAAEEQARDQGATKITLRVLGTNAPARRLYERSGYVVEGILRGEFRIDGVDVDDYNLARYLTADGDQR